MASPDSIIGRTLGHYRILEQIGAGGMGVVYRAHDERLERDVALKVLPPGTLADEGARYRFRKEALALSRLNHPNIATVFDFDTEEGIDFLVTELIPGMTLDERLAAGPLPEKEVIQVGMQLAEGLEAAHQQGVIHRDLKPGNLRLTPEGRLKILDFGLAKRMNPVDQATVTRSAWEEPGPAGTLAYMAPEQLRGEKVDARSDIWAAGATLYEMAAGQPPFVAKTVSALAGSILHERPGVPRTLNPDLSPGLQQIILKCLNKDPQKRYQLAPELLADLRRLMAGAPISPPQAARPRPKRLGRRKRIQSLAVLPLTNLSRDPEQEYFADGMTEALISDLAKLRALRIISRTSAMRYKGSGKSLPEIAGELNVDGLVEGSVLRVGPRVRITVQLIHAATDTHLWAESYERDLQDVLLLQSGVARAIAEEIKIAVSPEEAKQLTSARRVNTEAYDACLKGRFHWYQLSREHLDTALEYFQLALAKDADYALAYVGIADVWGAFGDAGFLPVGETLPRAKAAALKALDLDDTIAEAHVTLANVVCIAEWDWLGAEKEYRRAIELNPNYADAHFMYSDFLISMKRTGEWKREVQRTLELDPVNFFLQCFFGWHLVYLGRYDEAIAQFRKVLATQPDYSSAHMGLWGAFYKKGMYGDAVAEAQKFFMVLGDREAGEALERGYTEAGYCGAMRRAAETLAARSKRAHVSAIRIARLYAHAGEKSPALDWLEKAYEERNTPLIHLSVGWDWDGLRDQPRFQNLLRGMNLPA